MSDALTDEQIADLRAVAEAAAGDYDDWYREHELRHFLDRDINKTTDVTADIQHMIAWSPQFAIVLLDEIGALRAMIRTSEAAINKVTDYANAETARANAAEAKVAAVERLADDFDTTIGFRGAATSLRAALTGTAGEGAS